MSEKKPKSEENLCQEVWLLGNRTKEWWVTQDFSPFIRQSFKEQI